MEPDASTPGRARRRSAVALCAGLLLGGAVCLPAAAQTLYSCVANGRTYTGDRPPPECANSDLRELNKDGSTRRVIPRPLTAEEQRVREAEQRRLREEHERVLAQRRRDRSLLDAYATEDEIEAARVKALASSTEVVRRSQARVDRMDVEKKRLDDEAEFYRKRELPDVLKRAYVNNEQEKAAELKIIQDARAEMQRINDRFDSDRRRFRELTAPATPARAAASAQ